ncbi:putative hydrolase YxeP [compost metagenome]
MIRERIGRLAEGTAQAYGADVSIDYMTGYPSLVNDEGEYKRFLSVAANTVGLTAEQSSQIMPAEDFAYYLQRIPGCFMLVGAGNPQKNATYPHHHPKFDIDEDAMLHAASLMIAMALSYQEDRQ